MGFKDIFHGPFVVLEFVPGHTSFEYGFDVLRIDGECFAINKFGIFPFLHHEAAGANVEEKRS